MSQHLTVVVFADDPLVKEGAEAYLATVAGFRVEPPARRPAADVLLVLAGRVTEAAMSWLREAAATSRNPRMRLVMAVSEINETQLLRAVEYGLAGLLLRPDASYGHLVEIIEVSRDRAVLPDSAMRSVSGYLRRMYHSQAAHGLSRRDIEILRMVADGAATSAIANALGYSERTIKNNLNDVMKRLSLRNRAHAVSYAIRAGLV